MKKILSFMFVMLSVSVLPNMLLPNMVVASTTDQMSDTQLKSAIKPKLVTLINRQASYKRLDFIRSVIVMLNGRLADTTIDNDKRRILTLIVSVLKELQTELSGDKSEISKIEAVIKQNEDFKTKSNTYLDAIIGRDELINIDKIEIDMLNSIDDYIYLDGPLNWRKYYDSYLNAINIRKATIIKLGSFEGNSRYNEALVYYRDQWIKVVKNEFIEYIGLTIKSKDTNIHTSRIHELDTIIKDKLAKQGKRLESEMSTFIEEIRENQPKLTDAQIDMYNSYYDCDCSHSPEESINTTNTTISPNKVENTAPNTTKNMSKTIKTSNLVEAKYLTNAFVNIDTTSCGVLVSEYINENPSQEYNKHHILITNGKIFCHNSSMPGGGAYPFFGSVQPYYANYFYGEMIKTTALSKAEVSCQTPRVMYWNGKHRLHLNTDTCMRESDRTSGSSEELLSYCKKIYPNTTEVRLFALGESSDSWETADGILYRAMMPSFECIQ